MSDRKTVLTAVVSDLRSELGLINPDYRRVGRMVADGLEALLEQEPEDRVPMPVELRDPGPVEVRARKNPKPEIRNSKQTQKAKSE